MYSNEYIHTGFKVDLFLLRPDDPAQRAALNRRITVELFDGLKAAVYAPDDLLVQKLRWYAATDSQVQFRDCINLLITDYKRNERLISEDYVDNWAEQLGQDVVDGWSRVKATIDLSNMKQNKDA